MDKSIFVIDDYSINLKVAQMTIKRHGFFVTITTYSEAQFALEDLVNHRNNKTLLPDVILLDLHMPVMNGWEFLDKFKEISPCLAKDIEIYILSSSVDIREIQRSKQYSSVNDFLSKPLSIEMMHEIMTVNQATAS